jgi:hypothetical protein
MTCMRSWKSHRLTSHLWLGLNPQIGRSLSRIVGGLFILFNLQIDFRYYLTLIKHVWNPALLNFSIKMKKPSQYEHVYICQYQTNEAIKKSNVGAKNHIEQKCHKNK